MKPQADIPLRLKYSICFEESLKTTKKTEMRAGLFIGGVLFLNCKILRFVTETAIKAFVFTLSER